MGYYSREVDEFGMVLSPSAHGSPVSFSQTDYLELGTVEGHDSTIHFVTDVGPTPRARSISLRHLPLRDVGQLSPTSCYIHGNCE